MKVVASDEVEVILITIIFAIVNLTMSYRGLITLKLTIEVSLSLSLTAELCESRFFPLMLRAGKRIIRKKDYRYRFSCLSSSLWHVLMKNDSFRSSWDFNININIYILLVLSSQFSYNCFNFNDSVSIKIVCYY